MAMFSIALQQENYRCQVIMFRKHKSKAGEFLHKDFDNSVGLLKAMGYNGVPAYENVGHTTFVMKDKTKEKTKQKQYVQFGSFRKADDVAGIKAGNNGFFGLAYLDEPVMLDEESPDKDT